MNFLLQSWIFSRNILAILIKEEKRKKRAMFLTYVKIKTTSFMDKLLRLKIRKEKFLNFEINILDYGVFVSLFEEIFINKEYYFKSKNKTPTIIDCGSNIGISVIFFKWLYPKAKITAFEPDNLTFKVLMKNIKNNNFRNVILINKAIYSKSTTKYLYHDLRDPGSLVMSLDKNRRHNNKKRVKTAVLSQFIKGQVDFIKMDIEGMEYRALNELVSKGRLKLVRELIIEYHHHIEKHKDYFSKFLKILEDNHFGYQISTRLRPPFIKNEFQDILIYVYKKPNVEVKSG